ncbi:MAG: tRNA pseudouridine(38-40) synthase TruA [Butyrivibrio sp.]|nr:tRNA pseudouridine(38-40) synthase TruA [Butyrivibrio sp.]
MKNYRLTVKYDGTRYYGWQRQPGRDTVQGRLEEVVSRLCGAPIEVIGAGRTDAGVHAEAMTASAKLETEMSADGIRDYMNRYLPDDIAVVEVSEASPRFHARYNAVGKTYRYTLFAGKVKPVFGKRYMTVIDGTPDLEIMREAAELLVGEHDFRNFCANPKMKKSTVRKIYGIEIEQSGDVITLTFRGNGFLQNMVRIMVGTLLEAGFMRLERTDIVRALETKERLKAGPTAPPQGLCLVRVDYQ